MLTFPKNRPNLITPKTKNAPQKEEVRVAVIRLTVEVPAGAPERQLGDVRDFCEEAKSLAKRYGHEVVVASPGSDWRQDEDLVVAVPIGYSEVTEAELDTARRSDVPAVVLFPDHLSVPAAVRDNPMVVEIKKWWKLGTAIALFKRFLGQYRGVATIH